MRAGLMLVLLLLVGLVPVAAADLRLGNECFRASQLSNPPILGRQFVYEECGWALSGFANAEVTYTQVATSCTTIECAYAPTLTFSLTEVAPNLEWVLVATTNHQKGATDVPGSYRTGECRIPRSASSCSVAIAGATFVDPQGFHAPPNVLSHESELFVYLVDPSGGRNFQGSRLVREPIGESFQG